MFFRKEIIVLGYRVNEEGIFPIADNLHEKIFDKEIRTKKQLQSLIGTLNWFRKYVPNLSQKINSITEKLKNKYDKNIYSLSENERECLESISKKVQKGKLSFPDYSKNFCLQCDASDIGMGSVLMQDGKIIGIYSRKFKNSEFNYTVVEKEFFGILTSLLYFENIIYGCYIEIYTDSNN
ncbi:Transposon Tf2-9 polyprotein [Nosema granulosis]|uniref:Transposon Tf2-9 polyprotein n=1 Tax=Nosema granulosis TaxID=83296 RepID=A0A9P6GV39_9MICR|nr:Transposon Tf2-9 polyprotein [Nosema granulosis]